MRFYLRYTGASCTIVDKATHDLIGFLDMENKKEAKKMLNTLCNMSLNEYIAYCISLGLKFRYDKSNEFIFDKDSEDWANKAWIATTKRALIELDAIDAIPNDIVTIDAIKEYRHNKPIMKAQEEVLATKEIEKPMNKTTEEGNNINKPRKLSKKLKDIKDIEVPKEDTKATTEGNKDKKVLPKKKMLKKDDKPKYTKDILRSLLASKKIDVKTYREEMKKLA